MLLQGGFLNLYCWICKKVLIVEFRIQRISGSEDYVSFFVNKVYKYERKEGNCEFSIQCYVLKYEGNR